jgi:hypothetical protein
MSDPLQPGQHPDADQLSAFAEHALPAHEYERTLAHLVVCPDCRSVVALSMPPMPEAEQPQSNVVRKPWFSSWKFALPLTAAAVAALTIVVVENRTNATRQHGSVPTQEAELHSASAVPPPSASVSVPAAKPSVSLSSNAKPQRPPAQTAGTTNLNGAIGTKSQSTAARATESEAQNLALHGAAVVNGQPPNSFGGVVGGISAASNAPSPQNPSPDTGHSLHQSLFSGDAAAPPNQPAAPTAITGPVAGPVPQPDTTASVPATSAASVPTASRDVFAAAPMVTARNRAGSAPAASPAVLAQTSLPSNLPAISVVSVAHRKLAIDTRNTLFLSTDDGKNWKAVQPQWQGHAISVALVSSSPFTRPTPAAPAAGTSMASFTPQTSPSSVQLQAAGSTLAGTITDPSGAVIPNADVTVTRNGTSDSRTVKTDQAGNYTVNHLAPGDYQIAARAVGFREQISTLNIVASEPLRANFRLPIGAASETVEVTNATSPSIPLIESPRATKKIATPSTTFPALPVFEMTTAEGEHWTSVDGQTWKRK